MSAEITLSDGGVVKILFGKDWGYGPWCYAFGVMWDKDPFPDEGAYIYRKRIILHLTLHLSLERSLPSSERSSRLPK